MSSCRILIVEDDSDTRETIKDVLELEGFKVSTAQNGRAALRLLEDIRSPCLILLDVMMPVMNGIEFMDAISEREDAGLITRVVMISGAADLMDQGRHGRPLMKKPVSIDKLINVAVEYCGPPRACA